MDIGELTGSIAIEDQFSSVLDLAARKIESFADGFEGAMGGIAIGIGVATAAVTAMTAAVTALAVKGSDVNDVASTFEHFSEAGSGAVETLDALRAGVKGTVDDMTLMKDANKLLSAGVKVSAEDFGTLSQASFVLQNRGLGGTAEMMNLVSQALLTGQTRQLARKLGVVDATDAEQQYANSLGILKSQLTPTMEAEAKRIAIFKMLRGAVEEAGTQELDFGEKIELIQTKVANWVEKLESLVAASPNVTKAIDTIVDAVSNLGSGTDAINSIVGAVNMFADAVTTAVPYVVGFFKAVKLGVEALYDLRYVFEALAVRWAIINALAVISETAMLRSGVAAATSAAGYGALNVALTGTVAVMGAALVPIAALAAAIAIGYQAWMLWHEGADRAAASARQATVDSSNLAILNAKLGTSFTDVNEASAEWIKRNKAAKPAVEDHSAAVAAAAAQLKAHKEAVQAVVDQVTKATQTLDVDRDAYKQLGNQVLFTIEAQNQFLSAMEKITESGRKLNADERSRVDTIIAARVATTTYNEEMLKKQGVTVELIEKNKALGVTEAELATMYGVSTGSLKAYETEMTKLKDLKAEVSDLELKASGHTAEAVEAQREREYKAALNSFNGTSIAYDEYVKVLQKKRELETFNAIKGWSEISAASISAKQTEIHEQERVLEVMMTSGNFMREDIDKQRDHVQQLRDAIHQTGVAATGAQASTSAWLKMMQNDLQDTIDKENELNRLMASTITYDLSTKAGMDFFKQMNPGASVTAPMDYFKTHSIQDAVREGLIDFYAGYKGGGWSSYGGSSMVNSADVIKANPMVPTTAVATTLALQQGTIVNSPSSTTPVTPQGGLTIVVQGSVYGDLEKFGGRLLEEMDRKRIRRIGMTRQFSSSGR